MRNLLELFEEVCDALHEAGVDPSMLLEQDVKSRLSAADIRVCGAYQPNYPLAANISHLKTLPHESKPDESVVWVTLSTAPHDLNPYAPGDAFDSGW